ncbi:general transcription factor 3C polypeptide 1 [Trichogramma pretiosum]|uniref:general transcription factor 3C polypeptide 1 n=1 Tax=Trichogramma pretiosum TaxID=7493 RepID=UPI0006C9585E|nr:general transcription factor 3C polypeptide 1 [Trichogramma pretiosum]
MSTLKETIIEEIALEGLDGITLEALWLRLSMALKLTLPFKRLFKEQVWDKCINVSKFKFYKLKEARDKLVIFDNYELEYLNVDSNQNFEQKDIYPHFPIKDKGVRGSCSTYSTREDITSLVKKLKLSEVEEKYPETLVIVADQPTREKALCTEGVQNIKDLSLTHYCLLERIGRARWIGEVTIKKNSNIKQDAKAMFYIRKTLQNRGLIKKQVYYSGNVGTPYNGQNVGTLLHLTKFFNIRKPKVIMWAEHLINYLKSRQNCAAEYNEVKNELNLEYSIKKFFKINMLQKIFKTDLKVPYRSYYPNSAESEWRIKNNPSRERILKLVTLADPNINVNDIWKTEEDDDDEDEPFPVLNVYKHKYMVDFVKQANNKVIVTGDKGISQTELGKELGVSKLISRTLTRNLVKSNMVSTYMHDSGRQRTTRFVSKKLKSQNTHKSQQQQIEEEILKIKEHGRLLQNNVVKEVPVDVNPKRSTPVNISKSSTENTTLEKIKDNDISESKMPVVEAKNEKIILTDSNDSNDYNGSNDSNDSNYSNDSKDSKDFNGRRDHRLFTTVNHIFKKYKLFSSHMRYKYTSKQKSVGFRNSDLNNVSDESKDLDHASVTSNIFKNEDKNSPNDSQIIESDLYRNIETTLIVQKPECKKKSQKNCVKGIIEDLQNTNGKSQTGFSLRLLRRANLILDSVKKYTIIDDIHKLVKYISAEEEKEGLEEKLDKNSLLRILQRLDEDNLIKNIKLIIKNKKLSRVKVINFICDPSVDINDSIILSAVEQAKLKFCMRGSYLLKSIENFERTSSYSRREQKPKAIHKSNMHGRHFGYSPKFIRMKEMHIFLYYLVHDHPGICYPRDVFLDILKSENLSVDDEFLNDVKNVYSKEIGWKMFVPPLPDHRGYPKGWCLMSDVHLRMPLSMFVKLHNVNSDADGLKELLDHPIKRHMLVKDVPTSLRDMLYFKRRYIFSIHELASRLCFIGLLQFGPQMLKEKDQVFVYLNQHSELLDTTSSAAGYHRVEDKPYPVTKFKFSSMAVVESYWYEMWNTCINTCLGGRSVVEGKDILLEDLSRKPEMLSSLKSRAPGEAEKHDIGFVPGDRKGAAGVDSAFFSHLKRNWNWIQTGPKEYNDSKSPSSRTSSSRSVLPRRTVPAKKRSISSKPAALSIKRASKPPETKAPLSTKKAVNLKELPTISYSKPPKIIRTVLPRKPMRKRVKYDEIDYRALQQMDKLRVDWEQHEDTILLVCKVAMVYLCPNPRRNLVAYSTIRDILRSYTFKSMNKTSRACQRRLLYMLKQQKTVNSVLLGVEELKQDHYVNKRFGQHIDPVRGESEDPGEYEKRVAKIFKDLVAYVARKYYNISNMDRREPVTLPRTVQEFNLYYKLKLPTKTMVTPGVSKEVREVIDIHTATINSVIHSSMCCGKERRSWAYQLFKVYQQYPEYLLRNAMLKIRADQMVTMKKNYMCAYKKFGNCMPMSSSQYQLSSAYYYKFQTKWPYEIFSASYNVHFPLVEHYMKKLKDPSIDGFQAKQGEAGVVAAIHDYFVFDSVDIDIAIPDQVIMLDPGLQEKDDVYQRIAKRFETILESLSNVPIGVAENNKEVTNDSSVIIQEIRSRKRPFTEEPVVLSKVPKLDSESNGNGSSVDRVSDELLDKSQSKALKRSNHEDLFEEYNSKKLKLIDGHEQTTEEQSDQLMEINGMDVTSFLENEKSLEDIIPVVKEIPLEATSPKENEKPLEDISPKENEKPLENVSVGETNDQQKQHPERDSTNSPNEETQNQTQGHRISDLIRRAKDTSIVNDNSRARAILPDMNDVRTRQTRIAMLQMREELHELTFQDNHHAHEYFVVNSCKMYYTLKSTDLIAEARIIYQGMELPRTLVPLETDLINRVLNEIKNSAIFPKNPTSYDNLKIDVAQLKLSWNDVDKICKFIKAKNEFGATLHEIATTFSHIDTLSRILSLLVEKRIVLRAGIVTVRYIYHRSVNPWIIHSYKILRLEREAHQAVPEGSVYVLDDGEDNWNEDTNKCLNAANLFYSTDKNSQPEIETGLSVSTDLPDLPKSSKMEIDKTIEHHLNQELPKKNDVSKENETVESNDDGQSNATNSENKDSTDNHKKMRRNRTILLKQNEIYRAAKLLDFNTAEEIKVVIKPWIRIDGVVNRRVLDRMLGAILCYCMEKPGLPLSEVQNRFSPAIQPYHTRELIEILIKLKCLETYVQRKSKVTLFSKPARVDTSGNPDLTADSNTIFVEPALQATLKFGMFLSNRSYSLDFLSNL